MSVTSGFFDSVSGDRVYDAEQMSNYFDGIVSDGVYENVGNRMLVRPASGSMAVTVDTGRAIIKCHWVKVDENTTVNLDPSDMQLNRIDAIVLRLDKNERTISLTAKKGTPAANPTMPSITRTENVYELYLASVYVGANTVSPSSVTDLRPSSYCGWVTGVIKQVDTSDLFNQYYLAYAEQYNLFKQFCEEKQAAFTAWFNALTSQLVVNTGVTKLQYWSVVSAGSNAAPLSRGDLRDFDPAKDILFVYKGENILTEGADYTIGRIFGEYLVQLTHAVTEATRITCVVLRNVIGSNVLVALDATVTMNTAARGAVVDADFDE